MCVRDGFRSFGKELGPQKNTIRVCLLILDFERYESVGSRVIGLTASVGSFMIFVVSVPVQKAKISVLVSVIIPVSNGSNIRSFWKEQKKKQIFFKLDRLLRYLSILL